MLKVILFNFSSDARERFCEIYSRYYLFLNEKSIIFEYISESEYIHNNILGIFIHIEEINDYVIHYLQKYTQNICILWNQNTNGYSLGTSINFGIPQLFSWLPIPFDDEQVIIFIDQWMKSDHTTEK